MELIRVGFEGRGHGEAESTWGQREVWGPGRTITLGGATPVAAGVAVADVVDALRYIVERHQTLRTRYVVGDGGGLDRQVLHESGEVALEVVDAAGADPAAVARAVTARYEQALFDPAAEWPVRMAAVVEGGAVASVVAVYNHLALDGTALDVLLGDLARRDLAPDAGQEPLAQAHWQVSPAGRKQSDRALRRWASLLRAVPARRFGGDHTGARYRQLVFTSPAADLAARFVATRASLDTGHVLLAAFAIAVARLSGNPQTVAKVVVNNRFRSDLASSVSAVSQFGLCAIDTGDTTFDEVAARAFRASLHAYKTAYHDPDDRVALLAEVSRERGEQVRIDCYYNDRRKNRAPRPAQSTSDIRAAVADSSLRWEEWLFDTPADETLYLHVDDTPDALEFTLCGDAAHLAPEDLETCARDVERVLTDAALGTVATH